MFFSNLNIFNNHTKNTTFPNNLIFNTNQQRKNGENLTHNDTAIITASFLQIVIIYIRIFYTYLLKYYV